MQPFEIVNRSGLFMSTAYCFMVSAIVVYFHSALQRKVKIKKEFLAVINYQQVSVVATTPS